MKKLLFILLSIISFIDLSKGQIEVTGIVSDDKGNALIGTSIYEKGTENGTISNIDGSFSLQMYSDTLVFSYIGFTTQEIRITKSSDLLIKLSPNKKFQNGSRVIEINAQYILSENENTTTIPINITKTVSPGNTNEILNTIPGLHMQSGGLNTNKLSIRGIGSTSQFATSDVKTFYNNIPLHSSTGESAIEDIGLHMADRIEIIKGATGSTHEAGYGGAIIIKNKNIRSENKTEISTHNTIGQWGHFTTQNQINISKTDHVNAHNISLYHSLLTDDGYRANNRFDRNNLTLNYTYNKSGKLKLTTLLNRVDLKAFIPSSLSREDYDTEPSKAAFTWNNAKGNEEYNRTMVGLNLDYQFDHIKSMSHTAYGQFFESSELRPFNTIDENAKTYGLKGNFKYERPQYEEVYTLGYRVQSERYGFDLFETEIDKKGSQFDNGTEERSIYEIFAQLDAEINSKWSYKLGVNTQYAQISAGNEKVLGKAFVLPEATVTHKLNYQNRLYVTGGKGINYFRPEQALLPNGSYSTNLIPSSAWNISLGSKGVIASRIQYRTEIYNMWVSNLIIGDRDETNQPINTNGGNASYRGLEVALRYDLLGKYYKFNHNFNIDIQYSLMQNRYKDYKIDNIDFSKNTIPGAPQQTFSVIISGDARGLFGNIRYQFVDAYHMRDDNSIKSDFYQLVNATAGYNLKIGKWMVTPRIDLLNLFNEKYSAMTLVNASSFGGNAPRYYYAGRPRNIMASIGIKYKI